MTFNQVNVHSIFFLGIKKKQTAHGKKKKTSQEKIWKPLKSLRDKIKLPCFFI